MTENTGEKVTVRAWILHCTSMDLLDDRYRTREVLRGLRKEPFIGDHVDRR